MRKSIVILLLIFANNLSFSQIQKGKWLIGGSISTNNNTFKFNSNNQYSSNTYSSNFNITPEINYVINDKFFIGGGIGYSVSISDLENTLSSQSSTTFTSSNSKNEGISGFVQAKYYVNISKNIWWNLNLKSGFGKIYYSYKSIPTSLTTTLSTTIGQNPALEPTYFYSNLNAQILVIPFQRFGIQLDIGGLNLLRYNYDKITNAEVSSNNISFNVNPSNWSLGVFYILGK